MLRLLVPVGLSLVGLLAGLAIGAVTRPAPEDAATLAIPVAGPRDYVRLNNQFVVPVLSEGRVEAFVILSLSLEVTVGGSETIYSREAKLRDALLAALFEHANAGGFRGAFTSADRMHSLRAALLEAAGTVAGPVITDVLIVDMMRQDA
jgi:flagellar FliL protein